MPFSDDDLQSLSGDFASSPDAQIVTPRSWERRQGRNAGFSHFTRAVPVSEQPIPTKVCARCKQPADGSGRLCLRHKEQHRRWAVERARRLGCQEWRPGGKGRPPKIVQATIESRADVVMQEALLADALIDMAAVKRRVAQLRAELTLARKAARRIA